MESFSDANAAPPIAVLYASQTGTAEEAAHRIVREGRRRHFSIRAMSMDDYDISTLINERLVVFVCATTGQGDAPDNMKRFWRFLLKKNLPKDSLCKLMFTVFGFGDSSYLQYNYVAKRLYNRLLQLSASSFYGRDFGDDQHELGPEATFGPWLNGLWSRLLATYPLPPGKEIISSSVTPPPRFAIHKPCEGDASPCRDTAKSAPDSVYGRCASVPALLKMTVNRRLTATDHFQDVRHIELEVPETSPPFRYREGDVLYVRPENSLEDVAYFLEWFKVDCDEQIFIEALDGNDHLPHSSIIQFPCCWKDIAERFLDLKRVPGRYFFELLAHFTSSEDEEEKLLDFISPEGQNDLWDYCYRPKRSGLEVLDDFPNTRGRIPLNYIFDLFPCIQPRAFSISSCMDTHGNCIHLTVAMVEYQTLIRTKRKGLCSTWLKRLGERLMQETENVFVKCWVKPGTMTLPSNPAHPVIMIGPGTGCAPVRSMMFKRLSLGCRVNIVFFGCRYRQKDFLYGEEWEALNAKGKIEFHVAFSRDQERKHYVQEDIRKEGKRLYELITLQDAFVYIAGNSNRMPIDVTEAFEEIAQEHGGKTEAESIQFYKNLRKLKRFQVETWA